MTKKRLTGLELERKRLERLRGKVRSKALRKVSESTKDICPTCGRKHEAVRHLKGVTMVTAPATPASSSEKGSEGKGSIGSVKESLGDKTSEESKSTDKDSEEANSPKKSCVDGPDTCRVDGDNPCSCGDCSTCGMKVTDDT